MLLSSMYAIGKGVKKDLVSAYAWSSISHADSGNGISEEIQELERNMKPKQIEQAQVKAKKMWKEIEANKQKRVYRPRYLGHKIRIRQPS